MLELVFGDSAAGSLRQAKSRRPGEKFRETRVELIEGGDGKHRTRNRTVKRTWAGADLGGSPGDVACLALGLSMGDLTGLGAGKLAGRKPLLLDLGVFWRDQTETVVAESLAQAEETRQRLLAEREAIRVWAANWDPEDLCGLALVCHWLREGEVPLSVVWVRQRQVRPDGGSMVEYRGVGEMAPEELSAMVTEERSLSPIERRVWANAWTMLEQENAPLRAAVNGKLMGVPEDFYDFLLRAALPEGETKVAMVIGNAIGQGPGVSDGWLYRRLLAMVESGEVERMAPGDGDAPYSAVIRKKRL